MPAAHRWEAIARSITVHSKLGMAGSMGRRQGIISGRFMEGRRGAEGSHLITKGRAM
jgi:hypothetical protein